MVYYLDHPGKVGFCDAAFDFSIFLAQTAGIAQPDGA